MHLATVVLPHPDSPTRPRTSPSAISKLTSSTARSSCPCSDRKLTERSSTSMSARGPARPGSPLRQRASPPPDRTQPRRRHACKAARRSECRQAARCLGPTRLEARRRSSTHSGVAKSQRGWKLQPLGSWQRVGERAGDGERLAIGAVHVERRREEPGRVGVPGRGEHGGGGTGLDEAARVHDRELARRPGRRRRGRG